MTVPWHLNSHFTEVVVDVSHKMYITLGLWGDEGWDFPIQLEFIKESLVSSVDVSAKIEVMFPYVNVKQFWQVFPASFPWLQGNYSLTKLQHILTLASQLLRELAYITGLWAIRSGETMQKTKWRLKLLSRSPLKFDGEFKEEASRHPGLYLIQNEVNLKLIMSSAGLLTDTT